MRLWTSLPMRLHRLPSQALLRMYHALHTPRSLSWRCIPFWHTRDHGDSGIDESMYACMHVSLGVPKGGWGLGRLPEPGWSSCTRPSLLPPPRSHLARTHRHLEAVSAGPRTHAPTHPRTLAPSQAPPICFDGPLPRPAPLHDYRFKPV
jgi:hypothetical protein